MSWLKKVFSSQSSQETQVVNEKTREDNKEGGPQIKNLNIEEEAEKESSEGSQDSWFSFWSGLSTTFSLSKKRELSNDEEKKESKKWWSSFCSQKKKKKVNQYFLLKQVAAHLSHLVYLQCRCVLIRMMVGMTMNRKKMIKKKKMTTMMMMQKLNFLLK